jgi:hypothetical protein
MVLAPNGKADTARAAGIGEVKAEQYQVVARNCVDLARQSAVRR